MHDITFKIAYYFHHPQSQFLLKLLLFIVLFIIHNHAFADDGSDLLQGTDQSAWATFNGTGKKYLYLVEGLVALFMYIKSKNVMALTGIVVVAIFINVILHMAGQS